MGSANRRLYNKLIVNDYQIPNYQYLSKIISGVGTILGLGGDGDGGKIFCISAKKRNLMDNTQIIYSVCIRICALQSLFLVSC